MMAIWALSHHGKELAAFRAVTNDLAREDCEVEAINLGLAARLPAGMALVDGVEIYCVQDDD